MITVMARLVWRHCNTHEALELLVGLDSFDDHFEYLESGSCRFVDEKNQVVMVGEEKSRRYIRDDNVRSPPAFCVTSLSNFCAQAQRWRHRLSNAEAKEI